MMRVDECRCDKRCAADAAVTRVTRVCRGHVAIEFVVDALPPSLPGQFLELRCGPADDGPPRSIEWDGVHPPELHDRAWSGREAFVRRPFSIADREDRRGGVQLTVISRDVGPGTHYLDGLRAGDVLNFTGPLGRPFRLPAAPRPLLLVGGGVGIPPLLYLIRRLHEQHARDVCVVFGSMSSDLMPVARSASPCRDGAPSPCFVLPAGAAIDGVMTTDDGSEGLRGRVTDALERLAAGRYSAGPAPLVFACGPEPMLRVVGRLTKRVGWDCQLCIERNMGCGMGTCLSCVVRVVDASRPEGWRWALSCGEGPVFDRDALYGYFDEPAGRHA